MDHLIEKIFTDFYNFATRDRVPESSDIEQCTEKFCTQITSMINSGLTLRGLDIFLSNIYEKYTADRYNAKLFRDFSQRTDFILSELKINEEGLLILAKFQKPLLEKYMLESKLTEANKGSVAKL